MCTTAGSAPVSAVCIPICCSHSRADAHTHKQPCRTAVAAACQYSSVANRWISDAEREGGGEREREGEIHLNHCLLCLKSLPQLLESFRAAAQGWKGVVAAVTMCTSEGCTLHSTWTLKCTTSAQSRLGVHHQASQFTLGNMHSTFMLAREYGQNSWHPLSAMPT